MRTAPLAALLAALLAFACARPPEPSPEYARARRLHAKVLADHPQDAAVRPEVDEVLALLAAVPPASADAAAAAELRARIEAERQAAAEEEDRRRAAVARAAVPGELGALAGDGQPAPAATPGDGEGAPLRLRPGMKLDELRAKAGECFERKAELEIAEGETRKQGEAWGPKETEACEKRYAAQVGYLLLFADGVYVSYKPAAAVRTRQVTKAEEKVERGEAVALPGGGYGRRTADGKVEPLPATATVKPGPAPAPETAAKR